MISVSTSKSGSNWLDRLRSSRGFPTGDHPDLDRFLSSSSSTTTTSASTTRSESTHRRRTDVNLAGDDVDVDVSDVLSDLFNMGECSRSFSKKTGRKQSNPRFFNAANLESNNINELCSSDDLRREKNENNAVASSGDNSLYEKLPSHNPNFRNGIENDDGNDLGKSIREDRVEEGEEEEEMIDMKEYTRSDVMVIDTSVEGWKSDKWVFRKKDEWKIKDKKKSKFAGKKKKLLLADDDNDDEMKKIHEENDGIIGDQITKKKPKILLLNKPRNDKARELLREAAEFIGKVPQSRFPCPKPPEKSRTEGSPVILLKSIPPSNNTNAFTKLGKSAHMHRKQPKKMMIL